MSFELSSEIFLSSTWYLVADLLGFFLLLAYHLRLNWVYRRHPEHTTRGRADRLRRAWIEAVRAKNGDILAIQTLRNWVMTASVFASTTIMIGLGLVAASFQGLNMANLSSAVSFLPMGGDLARTKLLILAILFFSAFLRFVIALRFYNQTGFLINLPATIFAGVAEDEIARTLNGAAGHYNRGSRIFLLTIPFVLWLVGPDWFLLGVIITLFSLRRFDYILRSGD
ncbi:MAG: DUF599 domain-containing protein [Chromatiaceae bacterium]